MGSVEKYKRRIMALKKEPAYHTLEFLLMFKILIISWCGLWFNLFLFSNQNDT